MLSVSWCLFARGLAWEIYDCFSKTISTTLSHAVAQIAHVIANPNATAIMRLNLIYLRFPKIILIQNNRLTKMNILVQQLPVDK